MTRPDTLPRDVARETDLQRLADQIACLADPACRARHGLPAPPRPPGARSDPGMRPPAPRRAHAL